MSQTAYRTHHATEVTEELVGQKVTLSGWVDRRRDHGGVAFIDLRDNTGLVQVVIYDEDMARPLRSEFVIQVVGEVRLRPDGNENDHLATGKIEVVAESIEVLAKSDALPFQVSTALENESENKLPGEEVRLKYRYLDLRRPSMQRNLKLRSQMSKAARHALEEMGFEEVETPTMIKSTPEGARDFVVPARLVPVPGTRCRSPRSCSSSCSWSLAWNATTSWHVATVMRISVPTDSRSSPSLIWKWHSWIRKM